MPEALGPRPDRSAFGEPFPDHLAIIMDGNGRWARRRGWLRVRGHQEGIDSVRQITTECARLGVKSLTLYAFSVENWKRPRKEISFLMKLLAQFLVEERPTLVENDIRLRGIGRLADLPEGPLAELRETERLTAGHGGMVLRLALSYGARTELADAARALALDVAAGKLAPEEIGDETLRAYLYDPETPDPDLLIRTAGELRLSNFLLWQASYSELYVAECGWPEFREPQLHAALAAYAARVRKFGGLIEDLPPERSATGGR
jgi:undecaprenyl diphosphate synthase